jgi:hypothetical protein
MTVSVNSTQQFYQPKQNCGASFCRQQKIYTVHKDIASNQAPPAQVQPQGDVGGTIVGIPKYKSRGRGP